MRFPDSFAVSALAIVTAACGLAGMLWFQASSARELASVAGRRATSDPQKTSDSGTTSAAWATSDSAATRVSRATSGSPADWAYETSCIDCHDQATHFLQTGHARTLSRATDDEVLHKLLSLNQSAYHEKGIRINHSGDGLTIQRQEEALVTSASVDWCFGSGTHAHTWVTVLND